ncbi:putative RNA helicase [Cavenderia fasciculata]|uniref:ATP-dependent RNA helicase n=1 Tax=Cavenderia fasciculata TaxID=261658 RepID=F4Q8A1_CACFS|nr:putative RNA helicase [Cavenderia fasciculata]EGG16001.1 putative RNA helicase [Cavenderia fasciculata]|eukprot:XP_004352326.1 putative RNA helicase [Cavenderia fasciculata]
MSLESYGLPDWIINNLNEQNIVDLMPVQSEIVPFIARTEGHDILVAAPTGSGKTLSYVLPIVQKLHKRIIRRLRVLVILPTHDLVIQTEKTFQSIIKGTNLVVESLGLKSLHLEQSLLVSSHYNQQNDSVYYESLVDIVVTTPGRLVEHLNETPGFNLQHLTYLVIDEADRLLRESYQFWLERVIDSTKSGTNDRSINLSNRGDMQILDSKYKSLGSHLEHLSSKESRLIKLLLSATMTYNPEKISLLELNAPLYYSSTKKKESSTKYSMPDSLQEYYVACPASQKPLSLIHIVYSILLKKKSDNARIICFTNNKEIAQRLHTLIGLVNEINGYNIKPALYSSTVSTIERSHLLESLKNNHINLLICSDILSRGMDVPNVDAVINYNLPLTAVLYVHRVGRTARAGKEGEAYTIVDTVDKSKLIAISNKASRLNPIKRLVFNNKDFVLFEKTYKKALIQTKQSLKLSSHKLGLLKNGGNGTNNNKTSTLIESLLEINKKRAQRNFE